MIQVIEIEGKKSLVLTNGGGGGDEKSKGAPMIASVDYLLSGIIKPWYQNPSCASIWFARAGCGESVASVFQESTEQIKEALEGICDIISK